MQTAASASRHSPDVADHVAPAIEPQPVTSPKVGDRVRLKKPRTMLWQGRYRTYRVGVVEEVLGGGTLFALRFSTYPNTVDMGRALLDLPEEGKK
jgi:hypothetical protein